MRARQWVMAGVSLACAFLVPANVIAAPAATNDLPVIVGDGGEALDTRTFGGKIVVVNFWASWCVSCRTELPSLDRLAAAYPERVVVIAASVDTDRKAATIAFVAHYPHLKLAFASLQAVERYGALGMPYSVVLDGGGHERKRVTRAIDWNGSEGKALLAFAGAAATK